MKKHRLGDTPLFIVYALGMLAINLIYAYQTFLMGRMVDLGQATELEGMRSIAIIIIIVSGIILIFEIVNAFLETTWIKRSMVKLKNSFIDDILKQDVRSVQKDKTKTLYSHLTNDFDRYEAKYIKRLPRLIYMVASIISNVLLLGSVNPVLMLVPVVMLAVMYRTTEKNSKPLKESEKIKTASLQKYTGFVTESIEGYEVIKQHQLEDTRHQKFSELSTQVQKDNYQVDVDTTRVEMLNGFLMTSSLLVIIVGGMLWARQTNITFGDLIIVFSAVGNVTWPISSMSTQIAEMMGVQDIPLEMEKSTQLIESQRDISIGDFELLAFDQTSLGYPDRTILNDVSFTLNRGEKILIVGPSGAGKSTVLKTIRQTTEPLEGVVTLNNHMIDEIKDQDYFSKFSTVDQIGFIFSGKLIDNITLYQDFEKDHVRDIMTKVGLDALDLETVILNDGKNLSGGQRARVLLARALCLSADVIVCDEIFASLDSEVAQAIERDLLGLDVTAINVSHIYFKDNLELYDRIYIVENATMKVARSIEEIECRMLEVSEYRPISI